MKVISILLLLSMAVGLGVQAEAYPTQGNYPAEMPSGYLTSTSNAKEKSIGDLQFAEAYPAQLSDAERFVVFGCDQRRSARPQLSMVSGVFGFVNAYYSKFGRLPGVIDEQAIRDAYQRDGVNAVVSGSMLDELRSPITGRFPRLDSESFSPGDMYVRALTSHEAQHMAKYDATLAGLLRGYDPLDPKNQGKLIGSVFYFRVYGEREIIATWVKYAWY